jgi:hypothetical protein
MNTSPLMTAETRAVLNAAFRIGAALGRKFESTDMTIELRQAAMTYAATYEGDFDFMLAMRDQALGGVMFFSDNQSKSILNCLMADAKRRLADRKPAAVTAPTSPARAILANVPDGRYRVTLVDGDHLALKVTLAGKESKFNGSRIISTRSGGDEWMGVGHIAPDGELRLWRSWAGALRDRVKTAIEILDSAEGQDGWLVAGLAFAQEGSQCFICGRDLDTPESLTAGYGPTCAEKHGLPWGAKAVPMSVRLAQATAATVEAPAEPHIDPQTGVEENADELLALAEATRPAPAPAAAPSAAYKPRVSLAEAKARGYARTYEEIFGED